MIILGLYFGHNASACVIKDGEVLINWELERWTRIKHDYGYNKNFIEYTLNSCGLNWLDVDYLACNYQEYGLRFDVTIPFTGGEEYLEFNLPHSKGIAVNHHLAHVAGAYYTSPYNSATIFTWDGGGDSENSSVATGIGNKIHEYTPNKRGNICGMWSGLCFNNYRMKRIHDWDPGSGAGKIMGLASYGTPNTELETQLQEMAKPDLNYIDPGSLTWNNCHDISDTTQPISQNVAASLQSYTTKRLIQEIRDIPQHENLCYAGGLALNCIANREIIKHTKFNNLHVPPFPNDTGLAIGCALYVWHHILDNPKSNEYFSPYTGPDYDVGTPDVERVSKLIRQGKIVCYYEGRSESGPRALGHRSILCDPYITNIRERLNKEIKHREWYRPYAPIIPEEFVDDYLEDYNQWSPYMQTSATIKPDWQRILGGVNHVDNTTRPQILKRKHNETLYNIVMQSGLPALLNTSFNYQEPIVETPEQAKATFEKMPVDALVIGDKIYDKR